MLAVEGGAGMRSSINRALYSTTRGIKSVDLVTGRKPDTLTVIGDAIDAGDTWKRAIFADDFGGRWFHLLVLMIVTRLLI